MDDGPGRAEPDRESVRDRLRELVERRRQLDRDRRRLTEEIQATLRTAHEVGWTWAEIADFAGYENAAVARNQATPVRERPPVTHPPGTYSVRDAAAKLGVSVQTIYSWVEKGRLRADDTGRRRRVFLPSEADSTDQPE